jgi:Uncharacterized conserved protein
MQAESSQRQIPAALKQWDHWMIWGKDEKGRKLLFAPWQRDDLYPVAWGADAETRPETDFETARRYWKHRQSYDMPDGIGANLGLMQPAPLLLHEPPMEPPLMLVDFDDVRDPETGAVTDEVAGILDRLDAFVEISQSGAGLHAYVYANLPGDLGKFIEPLQDGGDIELYDHARAIGATWEHVDGTPDTVPDAQDVIDDLVATYESRATRRRRLNPSGFAPGSGPDHADFDTVGSDSGIVDSGGDRSPYFDITSRKSRTRATFDGMAMRLRVPIHSTDPSVRRRKTALTSILSPRITGGTVLLTRLVAVPSNWQRCCVHRLISSVRICLATPPGIRGSARRSRSNWLGLRSGFVQTV